MRVRLAHARQKLAKRGCTTFVLYLWRPQFAEALDLVEHDYSCYHIDDEYSFASESSLIHPIEEELLKRVDQVIIHSRDLVERKGFLNQNTVQVPNGVDFNLFSTPCEIPSDIKEIPRPIIGYCGVLKRQLDWTLIKTLAHRNPDKSFVMVGGISKHTELEEQIKELKQLGNVYFLGRKSVEGLACYPQHFDVCILPYVKNDYTDAIYPLKLHEYLASGTPVIGTNIKTLLDFDSVIQIPDSNEQWQRALGIALSKDENNPQRVLLRQRVASQHDWSELVKQIANLFLNRN